MREKVVEHKRVNRDYKIISDFRHVSPNVVYYVQNGKNIYFNIEENLELNKRFSVIYPFNEYGYALARIDIDPDKKYYAFCYINELGEVISPIISNIDFVMVQNITLDAYLDMLKDKEMRKKLIKDN